MNPSRKIFLVEKVLEELLWPGVRSRNSADTRDSAGGE